MRALGGGYARPQTPQGAGRPWAGKPARPKGKKMAIYHLCCKTRSRGSGASAVASSCYISGERRTDERQERVFDYRSRADQCVGNGVAVPAGEAEIAPEKAWNLAEKAEKRKDATVCRVIDVALPKELELEKNVELLYSFAGFLADKYRVYAEIAVHTPKNDRNQDNVHGHIQFSTRRFKNGEFVEKTRELDDIRQGKKEIESIRNEWAKMLNLRLKQNGITERVSALSLEAQGEMRTATRHLGHKRAAMERKGLATDNGDYNIKAKIKNEKLREKTKLNPLPLNNATLQTILGGKSLLGDVGSGILKKLEKMKENEAKKSTIDKAMDDLFGSTKKSPPDKNRGKSNGFSR